MSLELVFSCKCRKGEGVFTETPRKHSARASMLRIMAGVQRRDEKEKGKVKTFE